MIANVAELVKELHAEAHRGAAAMLERYVVFVKQAAKGQLSPADAEKAATLAYELELPADRFDRDTAAVRMEQDLCKQMDADADEAARSRQKGEELRARLLELEQQRRATLAAQHGLFGESHNRQQRRIEHARLLAESPHLFADPGMLTNAQWQAIRR
jgi:hypothetical protein